MTENIVKFYPKNAAESPDAVLEQSVGIFDSVFVLGWDKEGHMDVRASMNLDAADINWLLDVFKSALLAGDYAE